MRKYSIVSCLALLMGLATLSPLAEAHYLWMENQADSSPLTQARIYYGEFEESLREKTGGRLDEVGRIEAWMVTPEGNKEISVRKEASYFGMSLPEASGVRMLQLQELSRPVQDWRAYDIGIVKPNFYAGALAFAPDADILDISAPANKTALGIYPVSLADEVVFKVFFKDAPLPNAKFNVHAPNGWSKEYKTDESGAVRFRLPWTGQYVFEVINLEKKPGVFQDVSYEAIRHRATFSWNVAKAVA